MNLNYSELLPKDFHPQSRVWIYQSSRLFTIPEALNIETLLENFVANWQSHGAPVKGYANLFFGQFVVLIADESNIAVGGCSTDSSVRLIKEIERIFDVNMFDRQSLAFIVKDKVQLLLLSQLNYAVENNFINPDTLYFNNVVLTKKEFEENWLIPLKNSWLTRRISITA